MNPSQGRLLSLLALAVAWIPVEGAPQSARSGDVLRTAAQPANATQQRPAPEEASPLGRCATAAAAFWNGRTRILFDDIDPVAAIPLCEAATRESSASPDAWAFLARALARAERYADMWTAIEKAVADGSAVGLWYRGVAHQRGWGVPADESKARPDWETAAERGDANAQLALAGWYINGIPSDPELGEQLLRKAAEAGLAGAQARLGLLLGSDGQDKEALRWLELGAKQGDLEAFYGLGLRYAEGAGVRRDTQRALAYFRLALRTGIAEFRDAVFDEIVSLTDPYRFFAELRRDENPNVRKAAIVGLHRLGERRAFGAIAELLGDPVASVRSEAIRFLGYNAFFDEARTVELLTPFLKDSDAAAREAAAIALSFLVPGGARAVLEALGTTEIALSLARSLVRPGRNDPRVIDSLLRGLDAANAADRASAITGLTYAADERGVQPIIARLADDDADVRRGAALGLAALGDRRAVNGLLDTLGDSSEKVRQAAVEALGDLGDGQAVSPIVDLLRDEDVRDVAITALGRLRDGRAVEPLVGLLKLNDRTVSDDAAEALGLIGDERAVPALVEALRSSFDTDVTREAYWDALVLFGGSETLSSAFALLQADPSHWDWAKFSLARSRDADVPRRLLPLLSAPAAAVRARVAYALGRIAFEEYVPMDKGPTVQALVALLADRDASVRQAATEALGEFDDASAVEPLIERLGDTDWGVREDAAKALGRLGDARAVVPVVELLETFLRLDEAARSGASPTHISAAIALGQLRDRRATRALVAAANDDSAALREVVAEALGEIRDPAARETLQRLAKDDEADVASAANEALTLLDGKAPAVTPADDQLSPDVTPFVEHFSTASDAAVLGAVSAVWTDWQGPGAPAGLVEQARGVLTRADAGEFGPSLGALVYLIGSRLAASAEDWPQALQYAERGLGVVPERQVAQRVALGWLKAEALWRRNDAAAALAALDGIQRDLLPQVNGKERSETDLAFATYTSVLRAGVLLALGRPEEARQAVDTADRALHLEGPGHLSYPVEMEHRKLIAAYRVSAKTALGLTLLGEAAAETAQVRQMFAAAPAASALEADAERLALESAIKANLALAANGNRLALETAQALTEELQLKSQRAPKGVTPGDADRRAAAGRLAASRAELARLDRQIGEAAGEPEKVSELRRERDASQRRLQEFVVSLKREHPEVAAYLGAEPAELRTLQPRLAPDTRVVQYLLLDDEGWAFVMSRDDIQVVRLSAGRRELTRLVDGFRTYLDSAESRRQPRDSPRAAGQRSESVASTRVASVPNPAGDLAGMLLDPLADRLTGVVSLVIVPNGPLHRLPFAALPWRDGFLIEAFDLRVLPSASSIAVVDRPAAESGVVVLGNPTPPSTEWTPLPAAEVEAKDVAALYGAQPLLGAEAKRTALVGQDLSGRLIHLALHAQAGAQDTTRLVLSDGYVTVGDVWGLTLEGSPLVVLSACQTGLGEELTGDEVVSLAKGFLFAGSRAVISTLWSVQDDSTRELMTAFHRQRRNGTATALAAAQRDLIARGYGPYHWAGFVLSGW